MAGWLGLWTASGCLASQRPAEKMVDPRLQEGATLLVAKPGPTLAFDRYRVVDVVLRDERVDGGPLAESRRATQQQRMTLAVVGGEVEWEAECQVQRRQPPDADFAAAADENRDEVAITCQFRGGEQRWKLEIGGALGGDLPGRLFTVDERAEPVDLVVEIAVWYQLWKFARRSLPTPLVQIRGENGTQGAMIFGRPERVWFDGQLTASEGEPLLACFVALRTLQFGLEA